MVSGRATTASLGDAKLKAEVRSPATVRRQNSVQVASPISQQIQPDNSGETPSPRKAVPVPEPTQLSVSVDDQKNVIYRFVDPKDGQTVRQVPPEEILKIMRSIQDMLRETEQKLKVAL